MKKSIFGFALLARSHSLIFGRAKSRGSRTVQLLLEETIKFREIAILLSALIASVMVTHNADAQPIPIPDTMTDTATTVTAGTAQANAPIATQGLTSLNVNGGRVVFDVNNQVYWLADANFAARTEGQNIQREMGITTINPNGTMDYETAQAWVQALNQVQWNGCTHAPG